MRSRAPAVNHHTIRWWDGLLAFWCLLWLVVGVWTGYQIWQLQGLSESTVQSGQALDGVGQALGRLSEVPLIGGRTSDFANQITGLAADVVKNGEQAGRSIRGLSLLIGLAVSVSPIAPVFGAYVPRRLAWRRDVAQVQAALQSRGAVMHGYLAERAVVNVPLAELLEVSQDPHGDLRAGRHARLAGAELARLGIQPQARSDSHR